MSIENPYSEDEAFEEASEMKEKIKPQKGFIHIVLAIGILIFIIIVAKLINYKNTTNSELNVITTTVSTTINSMPIEYLEKKVKGTISRNDAPQIFTELLPEDCSNKNLPQNISIDPDLYYYFQDLNGDGRSEVIIGALGFRFNAYQKCIDSGGACPAYDYQATCIVVALLDASGNYKKIGELETNEGGAVVYLEIRDILDINNDNQEEIIVDFKDESMHGVTSGIFYIDFDKSKIDWLKVKEKNGIIRDAFFLSDIYAMGSSSWGYKDLDQNGKKEIYIITVGIEEGSKDAKIGEMKQLEDGTWEKLYKQVDMGDDNKVVYWSFCEIKVYKWDGSFFAYDEKISQKDLDQECEDYY